jgi:hypothetical protein
MLGEISAFLEESNPLIENGFIGPFLIPLDLSGGSDSEGRETRNPSVGGPSEAVKGRKPTPDPKIPNPRHRKNKCIKTKG